jgi:Cadherin-like
MAITIVNSGVQTINPSGATSIKDSTLKVNGSASGSAGAAKITFTGVSLSPGLSGAVSPQHTIAKGGVPVTTFTQADINAGTITYVGYPPNVLVEYITVRYTVIDMNDSPPTSKAGSFQLRYPIPDRSPEGTPGDWPVPKFKDSKASNAQFNWTDLKDPASQIIFVVQDVLQYGDLYYKGVKQVLPGKPFTFTQEDVNKGYISYKSFETVDQNLDYLVFKVRDSNGNWSGLNPGEIYKESDANVYRMKIIIEDKPLTVVKDSTEVDKCATITLGTDVFQSVDEDDPQLVITYTLLDDTGKNGYHVKFGKLMKNGTELKTGDTWTQSDIDAGAITYTQGCTDDPVDTFHFSASTTKDVIKDHTYTIKLIPDFAPNVTINPLEVPKCETKVITTKNINIVDPEGLTPDQLVVYMDPAKSAPVHGTILFNGAPLTAGTKFTFADIVAGKLAYQHDCTDHDPATDEFNFVVEDQNNSNAYTLPINIQFPENKPPYMEKNPCHTAERAGEVVWSIDEFLFADDDTDPSLVTLQFTALPQFGEFYIDGLPVDLTAVYKLSEWTGKQFRYVSKTPTKQDKGDEIPFVLNDDKPSNKQENYSVCIKYPPPPIVCPTITNKGLKTAWTSIKAISEIDLFATTDGIADKDEIWSLTKSPVFGQLTKDGAALIVNDPNAGSFTSQDILDGRVAYAHTTDTTPETDELELHVTNGFCSLTVVFTITFLPGLEVDHNEILEAHQGSTDTIDSTHLHAKSGQVSSDDDIKFTITTTTKYGTIQINGVDWAAGTNDTFSQTDINNGTLTYIAFTDQSDNVFDSFIFDATDGFDVKTEIFKIKIILLDLPPEVVINPLSVGEETCAGLTVMNIKVTDRDSTNDQLMFSIKTTPIWGTLSVNNKEVTQTDLDKPLFSYQDLINGSVVYCETEVGATLDSFDFVITDSGGNVTDPLTLPIQIIPPPPPVLVNKGMIIDPCKRIGITANTLGLANLKTTRDKTLYVFTITVPPSHGYLTNNGVQVNAGDTFTLLDITAGVIAYTGTTYRSKDPDQFTFDLIGPDVSYIDQLYNIRFRQINNPPWICVNRGLDMFENETAAITINMLQMCDVDLDYDSYDEIDYPVGPVATPADSGTSGYANVTVNIQYPGQPYTIDFNVTVGSARLFVRDQTSAIMVKSSCQTLSSGTQTYTFTPPATSNTIAVQVFENCVTGETPAQWTTNLQKS